MRALVNIHEKNCHNILLENVVLYLEAAMSKFNIFFMIKYLVCGCQQQYTCINLSHNGFHILLQFSLLDENT